MTLAELFEAAGITEYADWSHKIRVTPSGNEEFEPRDYQIQGLNHMAAYIPRSGDFSDPGTGKTLKMQAFMLWLVGLGNKAVGVMPPALVIQFNESFFTNFPGIEAYISVDSLIGDVKKRQKKLDKFGKFGYPDILLMSYQTFRGNGKAPVRAVITPTQRKMLAEVKDEKVAEQYRKRFAEMAQEAAELKKANYLWKPGEPITALNFKAETCKFLKYTLLVCDEAQAIKNPGSSIHQCVKDFVEPWEGSNSNGLILATGTPVETNVQDAYGFISLLTPDRYGNWQTFENRHIEYLEGSYPNKIILCYNDLEYLNRSLYLRACRTTKREAFPQMPVRVISELEVNLHKDHKEVYRELVEQQVLEVDGKLIDATVQQRMYHYVQQILLCPEKFSDKPFKTNALLETIDEILATLGGRKVIVYAWHQASVERLKTYYKRLNPAMINGTVSGSDRNKAKRKFIKDSTCKMLIANPKSGGVGIDGFQDVCSYIIFAEIYPHPGGLEQAIGRLERSGQKETVNVFLLVPRGTIAVKLRNDLCRKDRDTNEVVKDKKKLIADMLGESGTIGVIT